MPTAPLHIPTNLNTGGMLIVRYKDFAEHMGPEDTPGFGAKADSWIELEQSSCTHQRWCGATRSPCMRAIMIAAANAGIAATWRRNNLVIARTFAAQALEDQRQHALERAAPYPTTLPHHGLQVIVRRVRVSMPLGTFTPDECAEWRRLEGFFRSGGHPDWLAPEPTIIPIRPEYVAKLLDHTKLFEFRTRPARPGPKLIYESRARRKIVAEADHDKTISGTLDEVWEQTKHAPGITRAEFDAYFEGKSKAHAMVMRVRPLKTPRSLPEGQRAPQLYARYRGCWMADKNKVGMYQEVRL